MMDASDMETQEVAGRCGTCAHWKKCESDYYLGLGECNAVVEFWNATTWDSDGEHAFTPDAANVLAFTQDGSDYRSTLLTRAAFGCVSWAAAEIGKALAGAEDDR